MRLEASRKLEATCQSTWQQWVLGVSVVTGGTEGAHEPGAFEPCANRRAAGRAGRCSASLASSVCRPGGTGKGFVCGYGIIAYGRRLASRIGVEGPGDITVCTSSGARRWWASWAGLAQGC